ncbi:MAG TPA: hypothetical protein VLA29_01490 [Acidimicrobiia bacterium]|nr:hypothetical protein [Acidimicrobiia bacterium]
MSSTTVYELIGYAGSLLVVVSLAMSSVIRLRVVNLAGSLVFGVYGLLIGSIPILITNVVIAFLNVWYLTRELTTLDVLGVVAVDADDPFLVSFMEHHHADIESHATTDISGADVFFVMLRDTTLAGVFGGRRRGEDELEIVLDYVAPPFRDLRSGECLYAEDGRRFADLGFRTLTMRNPDSRHLEYLGEMGFDEQEGVFIKHVG